MHFEWTIYFWFLFITAVLSVCLASVAWKRRTTRGGATFTLIMLAITEWALVAALESAAVEQWAKIFWSKWEYLGSSATAALFLTFAFEYTGHTSWLTKRNRILIWIFPLFNMTLAATNEWHNLVWTGFSPSTAGQNFLIYHHGPGFLFVTLSVYVYLAIATIVLSIAALRASVLQCRQTRILVSSIFLPWIGSLLYLTNNSPIPGLNIIPTSLLITGFVIAWAIFKLQFLDLVPVARHLVLEKMYDGMIAIDHQHRILDLNIATELMIGISGKKAVGQSVFKLFPPLQNLMPVLETDVESNHEISWNKDGNNCYLEIRISPLIDHTNQVRGNLLVWHDITQRKLAEQDRKQLIKKLQEANATKDRFFSIISHDLRNPFNTISSFIRIMTKHIDKLSEAEIMDLCNKLENNAKRTSQLLENLLEWAHAKTDSLQFEPDSYNLHSLVQSETYILETQARTKQIQLAISIPDNITTFADKHITGTVLRNLISNAIKFTPKGGKIQIKAEQKNNQVSINIIDTGVGISEEGLNKLFRIDTKFSTEGTELEQGSGLGLILCKELIEKQGGNISVHSIPGEGSTFTFTLPAAQEYMIAE